MIRHIALLACATALTACGGPSAPAGGDPSAAATPAAGQVMSDNPELCTMGLKVLTPGGKLGTVTRVEGGGCTVTVDETGLSDTWAEFMLKPAPGSAPPMEAVPGAPVPGWYQCSGGAAGNFRIEFRLGNAYANSEGAAGAYTFNPQTADIDFTSGPWTGFYSRVLKDGDVGISGKPDRSFFNMTCERE